MKRVLSLIGLSILVLSLVFGCASETAPPVEEAPPPEEEEEAPPPEEEAPPPEVIEWRYHTPHTEGRAELVMQQDWCDMVYEATDGRLKVTVYPGRALGFTDADMLRICGEGTIESFMSYPGYVSRDEPALAVIVPHFVLRTRDEFLSLMPFANEQYNKLYGEYNIRVLTEAPGPQCYTCLVSKEPLNTIEAMEGKKIRGWDVIQAAAAKSLGIALEIFPQSEAYLALKTGMLDGSLHSIQSVPSQSLQEVTDYVCVVALTVAPLGVACNVDAFEALPADIQDIVLKTSQEHQDKWFEKAMDCSGDQEALDFLEEAGMTVLDPLSDEDTIILTDAGLEAWIVYAEEHGAKAVEYQKLMQAELERLRGG